MHKEKRIEGPFVVAYVELEVMRRRFPNDPAEKDADVCSIAYRILLQYPSLPGYTSIMQS